MGTSTSHNPTASTACYRDSFFTFFYIIKCDMLNNMKLSHFLKLNRSPTEQAVFVNIPVQVLGFHGRQLGVGIATGYGLDDLGVGVRVPVEQEFSLVHVVQTGFGAHPASYPMRTGGSFPGG
jgi:hypothetical protein